ncbi:hypothetical protein N7V01_004712, partial [Salmonella enterica subsp. enterica]|nr:hypothetical protein [Salmonella enterica subsp. enterica]
SGMKISTQVAEDPLQMREQWLHGLLHHYSEQFYPDGMLAQQQYYDYGKLKKETERCLPDGRFLDRSGIPQSRLSKWFERL